MRLKIDIVSPSGRRKWRIEPYDNGLCFRILKTPMGVERNGRLYAKNGKEIKSEWVNCEKYPTSIDSALEHVVDLMLADPDDPTELEFDAADVRKAATRVLREYIKKAKMEIEKESNHG